LLPSYWFERGGDVEITEKYEQAIKQFWLKIQK